MRCCTTSASRGRSPDVMPMYCLTKLPDGPRREGTVSSSLQPLEASGRLYRSGRERPTLGEQLLVGALFRTDPDVPAARITSPVTRIVYDERDCVIFETASGSLYEWTRFEPS
jgi:hypothetical protein